MHLLCISASDRNFICLLPNGIELRLDLISLYTCGVAFTHTAYTSNYLWLKYSVDGFSTPKQLTYCSYLTFSLAAFYCACWHFNARTTFANRSQNLKRHICRFTAESDAAAKGQHGSYRLTTTSSGYNCCIT